MSALELTDRQSKAVQVAPRVSKAFIESQIARTFYCTGSDMVGIAYDGPPDLTDTPAASMFLADLQHHTLCIVTTVNGFTVIGHSAPASPANFNEALGRQYAYENAFRQLWPLYAFALLQDHQPAGSVLLDPLNQAAGA